MRRAISSAAIAAVVLGGCAQRDEAAAPSASAAGSADLSPWSREHAPAPLAATTASALAPPTTPDPDALAEIVAAAGRAPATAPSDGPTKIGTDTKAAASASALPVDNPADSARLRIAIGQLSMPTSLSTPSIERAARAQLYWSLVSHCRDAGGKILPPDVIRIRFVLDGNGAIIHSTISVAPTSDPKYQAAADCMRSELETSTFRAEPAANGHATAVNATVPSSD